jgi:CubicO group peptidase (beta-lactamase class C family)
MTMRIKGALFPARGFTTTLAVMLAACAPAGDADPSTAAPEADPLAIAGVSGPALPMGTPADAGMSAPKLAEISATLQAMVDDGRIPGAVTLVARQGRIVHWDAVGMRDVAAGDPLEPDDLFRIYSMTKPVTSTAIMMLVESGDVGLDDRVSKYIPGFADVVVLAEDGSHTAPDSPITVRHLLSHTSGLTYGLFGDTEVDRLYMTSGLFGSETLEQFVAAVADLPLLASPGTVWNYSVSTDVLGRIVEVASGSSFDVFLHDRIFEPLGMDDTAFWVPEEKRGRFMNHYAGSPEGLQLVDSAVDGDYSVKPGFLSGGGGLVSTTSDYIRFAQMILQEGELDGVRILRTETVRAMRSNELAEELGHISLPGWMPGGYGFGLGFATLVDPDATPIADQVELHRWGGLANTFFWIDPGAELIGMVWTQMDPFLVHGLDMMVQTMIYDALEAVGQ